ncbi:CBO0543 family protein [Neobacillus niacini]|uniref:CBO0543 family protein n=1 Tax=Neobacillus niacini TaxID=86668 RepID=UPI003B02053D
MLERKILKYLWILGIILFSTIFRKPIRERWIVFLFNSVLNIYLDNYLVHTKRLKYPVRVKHAGLFTRGSILYDNLLCPIVTLWYCQSTKNTKKISEFLFKTFLYVLPQTVIEIILEKYTDLIEYKKGWKWYHTFGAIAAVKMLVRGFIQLIQTKANREELPESRQKTKTSS